MGQSVQTRYGPKGLLSCTPEGEDGWVLLIRPTEGCRSGERPQTLVTSLSNLTSLVHAEQNNQLPNPSNVSGITNKIQIVTSAKELSFTLFVC